MAAPVGANQSSLCVWVRCDLGQSVLLGACCVTHMGIASGVCSRVAAVCLCVTDHTSGGGARSHTTSLLVSVRFVVGWSVVCPLCVRPVSWLTDQM